MKRFVLALIAVILWGGCNYKNSDSAAKQSSHYGKELEVFVTTDDGAKLYGTLTMPKGVQQPPVVLIIPGSGPTDRDGNQPKMKSNIYKILADSLAAHGIASLRYDKRGVGKSRVEGLDESQLRFEQYAKDAAQWIRWLRNQHHFSKIVVLGHSEGSLLGILAAQQEPVDGFISVAGAGRPIDTILKEQLAAQSAKLAQEAEPIIDSLKAGKTVKQVPKNLRILFRPSVQPYLISWMKYDPAKEIAKLDIPILVVQGSTDLQVSTTDAKLLAQANPRAKLVIIEGMNHVFRKAPKGRLRNILTYTNPRLPLMHEFVEAVVKFIKTLPE